MLLRLHVEFVDDGQRIPLHSVLEIDMLSSADEHGELGLSF